MNTLVFLSFLCVFYFCHISFHSWFLRYFLFFLNFSNRTIITSILFGMSPTTIIHPFYLALFPLNKIILHSTKQRRNPKRIMLSQIISLMFNSNFSRKPLLRVPRSGTYFWTNESFVIGVFVKNWTVFVKNWNWTGTPFKSDMNRENHKNKIHTEHRTISKNAWNTINKCSHNEL